jgi:Peptidase inhibitor I78 family
MTARLSGLLILALAGCAAPVPGPVSPPGGPPRLPPTPAPDTCGAAGVTPLIGQPEAVLAATTFARPIRILRPGQPMTEDYSAQRLNITLDAQGRITGGWCG